MTLKTQTKVRDRFVAFAFAASDFLMEITKTGKIVFAAGQVLTLTGEASENLEGQNWLPYFTKESHGDLASLLNNVQQTGRLGPITVGITNIQTKKQQQAIVMGMIMPDSPNIYLTFNTNPSFFDFLEIDDQKDAKLLDGRQFEVAAVKAFQDAKKKGKELEITFLDTVQINRYKAGLTLEDANIFNENFNAVLKEQSFQGNSASQLDKERYALIHESEVSPEFIEQKIQELIKFSGQNNSEINLRSKTLDANLDKLSEREARRALIYTINQVEMNGLDAASDDLSKEFDVYLRENASKISRLKALVGQQGFEIYFQPIVEIPSEDLCHYEALVRFDSDKSPYELIVFGEDIGIAPDVDMAILKQVIGMIKEKQKTDPDIRVAVNISGQSIQSEMFFDKMIGLLTKTNMKGSNILFEITESTGIVDLEGVNKQIQRLREKEFEVCLDDFGAGSASFQYLNGLEIDCVKIDGKYIRDALTSPRDEAMVRNLSRMCQDLGVTTIAEMVETQEQLDYLVKIGVDKGQGWIFGKAGSEINYNHRQK